MTTGPTQLVVLGFDRLDHFRGQLLDELRQIRGRDLIRLLDLLFVARDADGRVTALDLSDLEGSPDEEDAARGSLLVPLVELDEVAGMLEPGTAAALLLVEHRWAARLTAAVQDAGGRLLAEGFLTPDARTVMGEALDGVAEAEAALEVAEAVRGAALVDALAAEANAERVADVVRVLVTAGILEDAAALDAVEALVAAGLLDPAVVGAALEDEAVAATVVLAGEGDDGR
jgi:uncharacterized membrane protein